MADHGDAKPAMGQEDHVQRFAARRSVTDRIMANYPGLCSRGRSMDWQAVALAYQINRGPETLERQFKDEDYARRVLKLTTKVLDAALSGRDKIHGTKLYLQGPGAHTAMVNYLEGLRRSVEW